MGAILDLLQLVATPIGAAGAVVVCAVIYFAVRWILKD